MNEDSNSEFEGENIFDQFFQGIREFLINFLKE
jgi:hypothetical protein